MNVLRSLWLRFFSTRVKAFCTLAAASRSSNRSRGSAASRFAVAMGPIFLRARVFAAAL